MSSNHPEHLRSSSHNLAANGPALVFALVVSVLPVLAVPFLSVPLHLQKGMVAALALGAALCFAGLLVLFSRRPLPLRASVWGWAAMPLFAAALLSAAIQEAPLFWQTMWGVGFEVGTAGSFLLFGFAVMTGALVPRRLVLVPVLAYLVAVFSVLAVATGRLVIVGEIGNTLAAGWPQLSLICAAAFLCCAALADGARGAAKGAWIAAVVFFEAAAIIFFQTPSALAIVFAAVASIALWQAVGMHAAPVVQTFAALSFGALLLFNVAGPVVPVPPDIRPSLLVTERVASSALSENASRLIVGSGPSSFSSLWERYRPVEFNATAVWNVSFESAWSAFATMGMTLGLVGLFAWLLWPFSLVRAAVAVARKREQALEAPIVFALAVFFLAAFCLYTIQTPLLLLGGLTLGMFAGIAWPAQPLPRYGMPARPFIAALLAAAGVGILVVASSQFIASAYHARGIAQLESPSTAAPLLSAAAARFSAALYERDAAQSHLRAALEGVEVQEHAAQAIAHAEAAVQLGREEWRSWFTRASVYFGLLPSMDPALQERAVAIIDESLQQAQKLAPQRPEVPYVSALISQRMGDLEAARRRVQDALRLKADYLPALELRDEL